jgi:dTDP-4-dehydrorhamnose 3,5-epimerase
MNFIKTEFKGVFIIQLEKKEDERGFFARVWDIKKFVEKNLNSKLVQSNISFTKKKGTIRGLHYQIHPYEETKIILCTKGSIFDVIIDLRSDSATYKKWVFHNLSSEDYKMLFIPEGFAHGFQTLEDNTEIFYHVSQFYTPSAERGIRWDDPLFNIAWPIKKKVISQKDNSYEDFTN